MFLFRSGVSLKVTYSPLQKRLPFCRSIYMKKVMKLLAFIFEQPSYSHIRVSKVKFILLDFSLTVKAATLIFISGRGSAISSAT